MIINAVSAVKEEDSAWSTSEKNLTVKVDVAYPLMNDAGKIIPLRVGLTPYMKGFQSYGFQPGGHWEAAYQDWISKK